MKTTLLLSAGLAALTLAASCKKEKRYDANNGQTQLAYQVSIENPSSSTARSTAAIITWNSGFANPSMVKFEAKQENSKLEYKATNTGQIDLFSPDPMTFGNFTLGPGMYKEIELKLHFQKRGSSPAIQLGGSVTAGGLTTPVVLMIEGPLEIKTEQKDVMIDDGIAYVAITSLNLASYTEGITEGMWVDADRINGTIIISKDENQYLYWKILGNIKDWKHRCHFWHK
ncbi:MAG: hypothetical protein JNL72_15425 [Flavipsychrobacter sp.]|nr:hypothetical protein [Flavipsychrobacter sp.]